MPKANNISFPYSLLHSGILTTPLNYVYRANMLRLLFSPAELVKFYYILFFFTFWHDLLLFNPNHPKLP